MEVRFYIDPVTRAPHIHEHQIAEEEVIEVLEAAGKDCAGRNGSRIAVGQTAAGRYLRVVYIPDEEPESLFVVTAYEIRGKSLAAYRKRRKKKYQ